MCTHHIPEYRVNMHKLSPNPQLDRGLLPLFKRSGGTSRRVRALVRIGHSSAESNKPRDDLNYLIPSLSLRSTSLRQNHRKYEKWDQSFTMPPFVAEATTQTEIWLQSVPLTTFSAQTQQQALFNTSEGGRTDSSWLMTEDDFLKVIKIKLL